MTNTTAAAADPTERRTVGTTHLDLDLFAPIPAAAWSALRAALIEARCLGARGARTVVDGVRYGGDFVRVERDGILTSTRAVTVWVEPEVHPLTDAQMVSLEQQQHEADQIAAFCLDGHGHRADAVEGFLDGTGWCTDCGSELAQQPGKAWSL